MIGPQDMFLELPQSIGCLGALDLLLESFFMQGKSQLPRTHHRDHVPKAWFWEVCGRRLSEGFFLLILVIPLGPHR